LSKEWAKAFYNSITWKNCREAYFNQTYGLCELCESPGEEVHHKTFLTPENISDSNISLNFDNLQLLCRSCHNAIHERAYEMYRAKNRKNLSTLNGLCFDENGDIVKKKNVFIVWGAPASGKTSYVKEHKGKHDIVIDLDYLISALSMYEGERKDLNEDAFPFALKVRELLYSIVEKRELFFENVWIVTMMPNKQKRIELQNRLKAELIHIDTDKEGCIARAKADIKRLDKQRQYKIINKYFEELEL
jgi:predicted kinase